MPGPPDDLTRDPGLRLVRHWNDDLTLHADLGGPVRMIRAITGDMIRIRVAPDGRFAERRSWAVTRPDDDFPPVTARIEQSEGRPAVVTDSLVARLEPEGGVTLLDRSSGRVLITDDPTGFARAPDGRTRWLMRIPDAIDGTIYGAGERTGLLHRDPRQYTFWNTDRYEDQSANTDELYVSIPFLLGLDGQGRCLGLFLNNTFRTAFDLSEIDSGCLAIELDGGELDLYVIAGDDPATVVRRFADLTGRMPLPPRWALGYHQARWSYKSAAEVRAIAVEMRQREIPADVIHLDIDAMDGFRVFTWHPTRFPDPASLAADMRARGFRLVNIVDAGVKYEPGGSYHVFTEGARRDCFLRTTRDPGAPLFLGHVWPGLCAFPDFARADVREWWGEQYHALLDVGVSGILNDMNEPALHDKPFDDPDGFRTDPPLDLPHGPPDEPATHAEIHNLYGSLEAKATRPALLRARPRERPFVVTRAGFAGIQRYAAVWTGDNWSTWDHLEMSLPQLMNLGLCGVPMAGADIGGFFGNCEPELFSRWMQLGAFYPFARNNSAKGTRRQEPWAFGPLGESVCRRALALRYRLLPYLYTVIEEATRTGLPILRPLVLHYPDDPATHRLHDQALVGSDLLIAPVVRPGKTTREVYLPRGSWTDLRTGQRHEGQSVILAPAPLDLDIPLFVRSGSIIPSGPDLQWTDERPVSHLTLDIYPGLDGNATGSLFEDDGWSMAFLDGDIRTTRFTYRADQRTLTAQATGSFTSPIATALIRLHTADQIQDTHVPMGGGSWECTLPAPRHEV